MNHSGELPEQLLAQIFNFELADFQKAFSTLGEREQSSLRRTVFQVMINLNINLDDPTEKDIAKIRQIESVYDHWRKELGAQTDERSCANSR